VPARLTLYPADQPARHFPLDPGREYLLGRGPDCTLRVEDPRLSRRHARLSFEGSGWRFDDLGSKNGTALAGRVCADRALRDGDWISFGGLLGQFTEPSEARIAAEQERERSRWKDTVDRGQRLDPKAGVDQLLGQVLGASIELAGAERGFIMLADDEGRLAMRARAGGVNPALADPGFPGSRGALARAQATGKAVVICDASADTLFGVRPSVVIGQIRALVCLPLSIGGAPAGLLYLDSQLPGKVFTQLDVEILEAFAAHAALVIGIATVREDLASLAPLVASAAGGNAP
jgi:pSer/pThr/pTyr-binding forkhead associated (FHA) protein